MDLEYYVTSLIKRNFEIELYSKLNIDIYLFRIMLLRIINHFLLSHKIHASKLRQFPKAKMLQVPMI